MRTRLDYWGRPAGVAGVASRQLLVRVAGGRVATCAPGPWWRDRTLSRCGASEEVTTHVACRSDCSAVDSDPAARLRGHRAGGAALGRWIGGRGAPRDAVRPAGVSLAGGGALA